MPFVIVLFRDPVQRRDSVFQKSISRFTQMKVKFYHVVHGALTQAFLIIFAHITCKTKFSSKRSFRISFHKSSLFAQFGTEIFFTKTERGLDHQELSTVQRLYIIIACK